MGQKDDVLTDDLDESMNLFFDRLCLRYGTVRSVKRIAQKRG